jgi:lysophospholipase L1-like esterase
VITEHDIVLSRVWHSLTERVSAMLAQPPAPPAPDYSIAPGRGYFKRNLGNIVAVARANGVAVVLLTMPMCEDTLVYARTRRGGGDASYFPDFNRFRADFDSYNEAIREVGTELRVPVIDLRRAVSGDSALYLDVVHHTGAGVRAIGAAAAAALLPLLPDARTPTR